jgi:hypothetical protein
MNHSLTLLSLFVTACAAAPEPATAVAVSHVTVSQGVSYQGVSYQGVSYQGVSYQGVSYQGASYGGVALSDASVAGSALVAWRKRSDATWEQRFPDQICLWNAARTQRTSCTTVNLATTASPLAGATWQGVYVRGDGTTVQVAFEIGASATQLGAVHADSSLAMFGLKGSTTASACPIVPKGHGCDSFEGCRANCDVWLYDVRLPGVLVGGQPVGLCPAGELATALAGTWDGTGQFSPSSTEFTFACTGGTIAKCTRWGYRPWDTAIMSDGATSAALAPYHQACIRAATADYCANGHSFTRNGTIVDIYDYIMSGPAASKGFIARTRGGTVPGNRATALVWESGFDTQGATEIDHMRYEELAELSDPNIACPERFEADDAEQPSHWRRVGDLGPSLVSIDSAPACSHSEHTVGKWLHPRCSACTAAVHDYGHVVMGTKTVYPHEYCTSPTGKWDADCAAVAKSQCPATEKMAPHGECDVGAGLDGFASGCTLQLKQDDRYDHCAITWDAACVTAADDKCVGGQELFDRSGVRTVGFCGPDRRRGR